MKRDLYLYSDMDRHGNQRLYFKPPKHKKTRINFAKGTPEAKAEYKRLMQLYESGQDFNAPKRVKQGSIEWMLKLYVSSGEFKELAKNTKVQRENFYQRFNKKFGDVSAESLTGKDLSAVRDSLGPGAGRNFLNSISAAYAWASSEEVGIVSSNPAKGVKRPRQKTKGYAKWSMDDVLQFKNHYPEGSNARICLAMLLFTAREISGVRTLGRADVRDGRIRGHRQKTWENNSTPMLATLRNELGDKYDERVWLLTTHGAPYSEKSLSQKFSKWARDAGLENRTSHGLRKSVATILAEMGVSAHTIAAVLAHSDLSQVNVYVQDANNRKLAREGMQAFEAEIAHLWSGGKVGTASD